MTEIDDLNSQLAPLGYQAEEIDHPSRPPIRVTRLGGRGPVYEFQTVEETAEAFDRLAKNSQRWCLDLEHGNVDVDRATGEVTPRDGGQSFNLSDLEIIERTGASKDAQPEVRPMDVRRLTQICIHSSERPAYGGWWHLRQ